MNTALSTDIATHKLCIREEHDSKTVYLTKDQAAQYIQDKTAGHSTIFLKDHGEIVLNKCQLIPIDDKERGKGASDYKLVEDYITGKKIVVMHNDDEIEVHVLRFVFKQWFHGQSADQAEIVEEKIGYYLPNKKHPRFLPPSYKL